MERRKLIGILGGTCMTVIASGLAGCYGPAPYGAPYPLQYYDYYYYPHVDVYFHIYTGWYYYRSGDVWLRTLRLPPHIRLDPRYRRPIVVREDPPHRQYPEHRETYPPPRDWRPEPSPDREERDHNSRQHEEYLKRWKKN